MSFDIQLREPSLMLLSKEITAEIIKEIDTIQVARAFAQTAERPRILFLSHRFPYPPIGGDRVKAYHLLRHLASWADVDVISLDEAGTASQQSIGTGRTSKHSLGAVQQSARGNSDRSIACDIAPDRIRLLPSSRNAAGSRRSADETSV